MLRGNANISGRTRSGTGRGRYGVGIRNNRGAQGQSLTFGLLDSVGREIITGVYDNKRFPTEAELALQHGMSRSVIREAMKMLAAKGLLSARPRQGTVLQPTSEWNLFDPDVLHWLLERKFSLGLLREFSELRLAVEPAAAELAALKASPNAKALIGAALERMSAAHAANEDTLEADIEFHCAVLRASNNAFFSRFEDVVATALQTSIRFTDRMKGHNTCIPTHEAVFRAINNGKADRAKAAMSKIVLDVMKLIEVAEANLKDVTVLDRKRA